MENTLELSKLLAETAETALNSYFEYEFLEALSKGHNKPIDETIEEFKKEWDI